MSEPTVEETSEELAPEYSVDISQLPKQQHRWIRRGAVVSCEGANHPWHKHFLR